MKISQILSNGSSGLVFSLLSNATGALMSKAPVCRALTAMAAASSALIYADDAYLAVEDNWPAKMMFFSKKMFEQEMSGYFEKSMSFILTQAACGLIGNFVSKRLTSDDESYSSAAFIPALGAATILTTTKVFYDFYQYYMHHADETNTIQLKKK